MTLPPVESGVRGMTRRNYLVELNRLRRERYEPTRLALDEEDRRLAKAREEARERARMAPHPSSSEAVRALPGGGPRSLRMKATASQRAANVEQLVKEEEAQKKAAYQRLYNADMKEQLALREATLRQMKTDEDTQMAALRQLNEEAERKASEESRRAAEENKAYMIRMRETNLRELEDRRRAVAEKEKQDQALMRLVDQNHKHRDEVDGWRNKNFTLSLKLQNEISHQEAMKWAKQNKSRNEQELAVLMERDKRLLQEEQEANEQKKRLYREEFAKCVERDNAFRAKHNYDEPKNVTRQRNELAAESYNLMQHEMRLQRAESQQQYRKDLLDQMTEKHNYRVTHLDEV